MKIATIGVIVIFVLIIIGMYPAIKREINFIEKNNMSSQEYECKEFCSPEKYYYSEKGSLISSDQCLCGGDK